MGSDRFVNRELSWLEFNRRVLEEAQDPSVPLLERLKFLSIFSSNLDEFFMVRVAALKRRIHAGEQTPTPDGLTPLQTMAAVSARVHELVDAQHHSFLQDIQPLLAREGILLLRPKEITEEQRRFLEDYFRRMLLPVVTPLAVDPGHPFPYLGNRSLCLVASMRPSAPSGFPHSQLSIIHIPSQALPRFIALPDPDGKRAFMLLEDVIRLHLPTIYNGYEIVSSHAIRVTRDADLPDLPTRPSDPPEILALLLDELELQADDVYEGAGFAAFSDLLQLYSALEIPRLQDPPRPPHPVAALESTSDIWGAVRERCTPRWRTARRWRCSSSCRPDSTRRRTSAGPARSRKWAPTWCTASPGSRRTARRVWSSGRSRTASGGTATSPPGTTMSGPRGSIATWGSSPAGASSART